ncbi:MAG: cell division protein FtsQ/DivIB [Thioalkalispiraceae bacterium]|jgi:cell division protein FtsQ
MSAQASQAMHSNEGLVAVKRVAEFIVSARLLLLTIILFVVVNLIWQQLQDPSLFPVNKVRIKGEMKYVTEAMLQKSVSGKLSGFFNTDVEDIQRSVEVLPWVARASVRRIWPETLFIQVVEQQPVARWSAGGFVNNRGEAFNPLMTEITETLPLFKGPENKQLLVFEKYNEMKNMLQVINTPISRFSMDNRHAIQVKLENNVELMLGRREQLSRLQRFINIYPKVLAGKMKKIKHVDLRYSNGLSIGWKDEDRM